MEPEKQKESLLKKLEANYPAADKSTTAVEDETSVKQKINLMPKLDVKTKQSVELIK